MGRPRKVENSIIYKDDICLEPGKHQISTPRSRQRILEISKKISQGWSRFNIIQFINDEWGLKEKSALRYYNAALTQLCVDVTEEGYVDEMRQKTIHTLEELIQKEIAENKYKDANTSMELLSKLLGYNVAKTETKITGDIKFEFGDVPDDKEEDK